MNAIEVINLVKRYGKFKAVDDISFSVPKGHVCAILGPNGSGKTTTIKSICNLLTPDSGKINVCGKTNDKASDKITALFEGTRNLYWRLTPKENLRYFAGIRGIGGKNIEKSINELLDRFNLMDKKDVMVNNLSRGMQQKVVIALTLVCNTEIIILDEPTLGLDIESFIDIKNVIANVARDMNKTILLSTHDMSLVQGVCDDAVILNKGKIVAQDTVINLLDMFRSMTYEFVLSKGISEENKNNLFKLGYDFYSTNSDCVIEVDITDLNEIYNIIGSLKENGVLIKEVKQKGVNFERVYLNLINGGNINEKDFLSI